MPTWNITIRLQDIFHDDTIVFERKRDEIVSRIRNSGWLSNTYDEILLDDLILELADTEDQYQFDAIWGMLYTMADIDRVWLGTV